MSEDPDKTEADARAADPFAAPAVEGSDRPELYVAAAFAGAFLFARILKKIAD